MRKAIWGAIGAGMLALIAASPASAALKIFACEPEWAALSREIGGNTVSVTLATTGVQDPHLVQARPSLISKARTADVAVCTGAELEIGWLPMIVTQSANKKIVAGAPGVFQPTDYVNLAEKPSSLDRSQGDIHAGGNPHIQGDPRNILAVAAALTRRMTEIDSANAALYQQRGQAFDAKMRDAIARWQTEAAPLKGIAVVEYHRSWIYLADWLGLRIVAEVEPLPGVPPASGYLAQLLSQLPARNPKMVIYSAYEDARASQFVAERLGIAAVQLPFTVGGSDAAKDLFSLYDDTVRKLVTGLNARK